MHWKGTSKSARFKKLHNTQRSFPLKLPGIIFKLNIFTLCYFFFLNSLPLKNKEEMDHCHQQNSMELLNLLQQLEVLRKQQNNQQNHLWSRLSQNQLQQVRKQVFLWLPRKKGRSAQRTLDVKTLQHSQKSLELCIAGITNQNKSLSHRSMKVIVKSQAKRKLVKSLLLAFFYSLSFLPFDLHSYYVYIYRSLLVK